MRVLLLPALDSHADFLRGKKLTIQKKGGKAGDFSVLEKEQTSSTEVQGESVEERELRLHNFEVIKDREVIAGLVECFLSL